jgi:SAM-dependent methyltransferase
MKESYELSLKTDLSAEELRDKLSAYEPWGHRIDFSNGISTSNLKRRTPFSLNTLQKVKTIEKSIPFEEFRGGTVLDIGCNSGYNSIYLASAYGMHPTGIDVNPRHIEVSNFLSKIANIEAIYSIGNAETYCRECYFDVVLHFGTLYHLPNPLLSLKTTYENLKKGGYLALETQVYDHPEDNNICYFMHMHNNDKTNFWALSTHVLIKYLEILGFTEIQELLKVVPKMLEKNMSRIILVARK